MDKNYITVSNFHVTQDLINKCLLQNRYEQGHSQYGTLWSVWECSMLNTDVYSELTSLFNITPSNLLLSKTHKEGLPRHFDINKWSVLNIPIVGDFEKSPLVFVDDYDNIIDSSTYSNGLKPIIFNARNLHAVLPSQCERIVLSVCWKIEYDRILSEYQYDKLINSFSGNYFLTTKLGI